MERKILLGSAGAVGARMETITSGLETGTRRKEKKGKPKTKEVFEQQCGKARRNASR